MNNAEQRTAVGVIVIVDSRTPLPSEEGIIAGKESSYYSILGLPQRRSSIRHSADLNGWKLLPELLYEMGNAEHERTGVKRLIEGLKAQNARLILIDDTVILKKTNIASALIEEFTKNGMKLTN